MGLDVYVGSLTRYFARDWKTILEQAAEAHGPALQFIRAGPAEEIARPEEIRSGVLGWRNALNRGLVSHLRGPLDWDESAASPYFTDKPGWDCYGALVLWAAYAEHPDLQRPSKNPLCRPDRTTGDWRDDPAFRRSTAAGVATRYDQLLDGAEVWLPGEHEFVFQADWPGGSEIRVGATGSLLRQLDALNSSTWKATAPELEGWRSDAADFDAPLETGARFGFSVLRFLAGKAAQHRLPMLLDY
jgi:hypothetical protein